MRERSTPVQTGFDSIHLPRLSARSKGITRAAFGGSSTLNHQLSTFPMANYGINGFGRIGRNVFRAMEQSDVKRIVAINDLTDTLTLAHLLKWDSVHGKFDGEIGHDAENIIVRGHKIKVLKERDPGNLPWKRSRRGCRSGIDRLFHQPRQSGTALRPRAARNAC